MQEFLTDTYGVEVRQWATPTDDGELYEVVYLGRVIRADTAALILSEVLAWQPPGADVRPRPRLAWTNVIAGTVVMPLQRCAA